MLGNNRAGLKYNKIMSQTKTKASQNKNRPISRYFQPRECKEVKVQKSWDANKMAVEEEGIEMETELPSKADLQQLVRKISNRR